MGLTYYGSKISPNMTETPEGYLICLNVPVARVGEQKYLARELGIKDKDPNEMVTVHRTEEEVFSPKTIASFEGKPFTDNHPEEDVIPENYDLYQKGHCQNVHRGTGENQYNLVADIYVTNPNVIGEIKSGKRQISCGYTCNYVANEDGTYNQENIQGNHIALVDEGRAGAKISIKDSRPESQKNEIREVKKMNNNVKNKFTSLLSMFARSVRDAKTNEEVDGLVSDAEQVMNGINETPEKKEDVTETPKAEVKDGEDMTSIKNALLTASLALNSAIAYLTKTQDQPEKAPAVENKQEVATDEEEPTENVKPTENVAKEETKDCDEEMTKDDDDDDTLKSMDALTEELEGKTDDDDEDNENKETEDDDEEEKKVDDDDDDELKTEDDDEEKSEVIESNTDDDDEEKQSEGYTKDAMAKFVKDMKPVIAQISNDRERQKVADMFAKTFRKVTKDSNSLAKIIKANENYRSSKVSDSKPYTFEDRQKVFDRLNPHNHKNK